MNILVIGSGGREHAIITSISKSDKCSKIYALPGNGGTELLAENIDGDVNDFQFIKKITLEHKISLVFVGQFFGFSINQPLIIVFSGGPL